MKENRIVYFDNITAVLLFEMIFLCHLCSATDYHNQFIEFVNNILFFFMAWFFFKGGMFFKEKPVTSTFRSGYRRLLVPFIFFNCLGIFADLFHKGWTMNSVFYEVQQLFDYLSVWTSMACWFLLVLFIVRIGFLLLTKLHIHPIVVFCVSILFAYYSCCFSSNDSALLFLLSKSEYHGVPYYIGTIFHGMAMFSIGYYLKDRIFKYKWLQIVSYLFFVIGIFLPITIDFRANSCSNDSIYLLAIFLEIVSVITITVLFAQYLTHTYTCGKIFYDLLLCTLSFYKDYVYDNR